MTFFSCLAFLIVVDATQFTLHDKCEARSIVKTLDECKEAQKDLGLPTTESYKIGSYSGTVSTPGGMGVVGEGNLKESSYVHPDCSYYKRGSMKNFRWSPKEMRSGRNSGYSQSVCKAFCSEVAVICPMGQSLRADAEDARGSSTEECCSKDDGLDDLDAGEHIMECFKRVSNFQALKDCAVKHSSTSRLFSTKDVPYTETPTTPMASAFAACAAALAAGALVVSLRRFLPSMFAQPSLGESEPSLGESFE